MGETKLRCGVIGLGMGKAHIRGYQAHPNCEVVAVCDLDEERLAKAKDEFGIPAVYSDVDAMLAAEKLDIVSIATPNKLHKPFTLAAAKAGAHVLCEKPIAMNVAEAREMQAAVEAAGKRLMINFSYRFNAASQALKRLVDTGVLGNVYTARTCWLRRFGFPGFGGWFSNTAMSGGGPLIDLGVHRIDLALWLMGYPEPDVVLASATDVLTKAECERQGKEANTENHAAGFIRFKNGASLQVEASWACHRAEDEFMETHLYGDKAGLVQKNVGGGYNFTAELFETRAGALYTTEIGRTIEPAKSAMECFADAILNDEPTPAPAEQGIIVQQILDGLYESAATGKPVTVE
ncbi:MAG: Gfo/Idh/MocA family oxidoreductase [Planctomycetota bacterium]|nr:Gfo/Idh/MocA family oxidoreductase [Planctomycetota bacterium]